MFGVQVLGVQFFDSLILFGGVGDRFNVTGGGYRRLTGGFVSFIGDKRDNATNS
jgi:hypothetical protein